MHCDLILLQMCRKEHKKMYAVVLGSIYTRYASCLVLVTCVFLLVSCTDRSCIRLMHNKKKKKKKKKGGDNAHKKSINIVLQEEKTTGSPTMLTICLECKY